MFFSPRHSLAWGSWGSGLPDELALLLPGWAQRGGPGGLAGIGRVSRWLPSTAWRATQKEWLEGCEVFSSLVLSPHSLPISGAGFPSVPVGKSPMVEQAVQTGSVDNLNAKKLLPGKGPVGMQLNGRPAQPSSKTSSGT